MSKRTMLQFHYDGDIWSIVEKWASENGYREKESIGTDRTYQKGYGFLVAPMMLRVQKDDLEITLEAWIRVNIFVRMMLLFIAPSEMGIESGGLALFAPRKIARSAVNKLINRLDQPFIK